MLQWAMKSYNTTASAESWLQDSGKGSNTSSSKCLLSIQTIELQKGLILLRMSKEALLQSGWALHASLHKQGKNPHVTSSLPMAE